MSFVAAKERATAFVVLKVISDIGLPTDVSASWRHPSMCINAETLGLVSVIYSCAMSSLYAFMPPNHVILSAHILALFSSPL
jgi:hypothetical protein